MTDIRSVLDLYTLHPNIVAAERVEKDARQDRIDATKKTQDLCSHVDVARSWDGTITKWVCLKCGYFAEDWGTPLAFRKSEKPFEITHTEYIKRRRWRDR